MKSGAFLLATLVLTAAGLGQVQSRPVSGHAGGSMTIPVGADPQTLNPVFSAVDNTSSLVASLTMADLLHINPRTLHVEPALATSVDHRSDRVWIVHLRHGVRFSDGVPFTSADVAFSFQVYTDAAVDAPERQLLTVKGTPVRCTVLDPYTVQLDLPGAIAVGDRLFDSVWMLPRHLLQAAYRAGQLAHAWPDNTPPGAMAGLGPFRVAGYQPGHAVQLARNPNYWRVDRAGHALPYLDRLQLLVVADSGLRLTLFVRKQVDGVESLDSTDFTRLQHNPCCRLLDAGHGLNSEVLVLNQAGSSASGPPALAWFRQTQFRQAISLALDRANLVRNVYSGLAAPLASLTSPSADIWADPVSATPMDDAKALALLGQAGFHRHSSQLEDGSGRAVTFTLIVPSSNAQRMHLAVFIQEDLRRIGIEVQVVPLDFATYLERLLHRHDFEAALIGIQAPDADPNAESNEWPLDAPWHFWNPAPKAPQAWEVNLDRWFRQQLDTSDPKLRLRLYRKIQQTEHTELPLIPLVAPDILVGVRPQLEGVVPALLPPHLLWNADELSWPGVH